jgi:Txe/YoeB family toxin of Txe-Axe toxin-antitoxin module
MRSSLSPSFRKLYADLPKEVRDQARKRFRLWAVDPKHPSLHFKKVGEYWSARVDNDHRVLGTLV